MHRLLVLGALVACHHDHRASPDGGVPIDSVPMEVGPSIVTLTVPFHPTTPTANDFVVAYQDGTAPWTRAPDPVGDVFTLPIASDRYGVLVACSGPNPNLGDLRLVQLEYLTVTEATHVEIPIVGCGDPRPLAHLHGTVSNLGATPSISVATGDPEYLTSASGPYELDLPVGIRDVVARTEVESPGRILVVPDVDEAVDTTLDIDFTSAVAMTTHHVHGLAAMLGDVIDTRSILVTANGTSATLSATTTTQFEFTTSPASVHRPGDVDRLYALVGASDNLSYRTLDVYGATDDVTATLRPAITGLTCATGSATPTPRVHAMWSALSADFTMVSVRQAMTGPASMLEINAAMTSGYRGTASSYDAPDLSTIANWPSTYGVAAGTPADCALQAVDSSSGPGELATTHHAAGTTMLGASAMIVYTP